MIRLMSRAVSIYSHFKSVLSLSVITSNLLVWCLPLAVLSLAKPVFPFARRAIDRSMDGIYRTAVAIDDAWLRGVMGIEWKRPELGLGKHETLIVLSNHVSWADILILQSVIAREGPILKFLSKRELIFVPILGLVFWAFEFPLLRRKASGKQSQAERRLADLEAIRDACRAVRDRPSALISFVEGTRFSESKRIAADSRFEHLLAPRVGGFSALLDGMGDANRRVIDLTLVYPEPVSFWEFLSGACPRVEIEANSIPRAEIPVDRDGRREWLDLLWQRKDAAIGRIRAGQPLACPGARNAGERERIS